MSEKDKKKLDAPREAEQQVLFNTAEQIVSVFGQPRTLRPLTTFHSRQLHSLLMKVVKAFNALSSRTDEERTTMSMLGDQEDLIIDTYVQALVLLGTHYKWPEFTAADISERIQMEMTISEIRYVVESQAKANDSNDFLHTPLRIISNILNNVTSASANVVGDQTTSSTETQPS